MAVNDFHFAMVNDHPRNEFFRKALTKVISPATHVLEIGTGSGLLAMIAAQLGAQHVTAIEANGHMAALAREKLPAAWLPTVLEASRGVEVAVASLVSPLAADDAQRLRKHDRSATPSVASRADRALGRRGQPPANLGRCR